MANDMTARAILETGMRFDVETGSGHHVILDVEEISGGQDTGPRPMEMLLVALASCAGMDIISILRKKRQQISTYEVRVYGTREEKYPKAFVEITVEHSFTGHNIKPEAVERAIQLTEDRYCGVSAMLEKAATITNTYRIIEESQSA